jgi:hypothetical protein
MPQHRSTRTIKRRCRVTYRKTTKKPRRKVQQRRTHRKVQQRRTRKGTIKIQSILFKKDYTKKDAINWLKNHGYKYSKIDETDNFYKTKQFPPRKDKKYRTLTPTPGIRLIIQI